MICSEMMRLGEPSMAYWVMISFWCYLRPSECMRLRRKDLVPPVGGFSQNWSKVVAPSEAGILTTKVGEQDDSIAWDSPKMAWFPDLLRELRGDGSSAPNVAVQLCGLGARLEEGLQRVDVERLRTRSAAARRAFSRSRPDDPLFGVHPKREDGGSS